MTNNVTRDENGNLTLKQGTSCVWAYRLSDANGVLNITGYTMTMMVRTSYDAKTVLLSLATSDGNITNGGTNGTFTLYIAPMTTSLISFKGESLECVYDIEVRDTNSYCTRIAEGTFTLLREVTHG